MQILQSTGRRLAARLSMAALSAALLRRAWGAVRRRGRDRAERIAAQSAVLPSLFDTHPEATRAPRRTVGLRSVPIDQIVGTMRHPSQNTADFLPLPRLRGQNWRGRWQRITRAMDRLTTLPSVDLVQVGDDYYVADGHNRVAAARQVGAVEIDAVVTQLLLPGATRPSRGALDAGSLIGAEQVRMAGQGRHSRTVVPRIGEDQVLRRDLVRGDDQEEA